MLFTLVIIWIIYYNQAHYLGVFYIGILCAKYRDVLILLFKRFNGYALTVVLVIAVFLYNIHFELPVPENNGGTYDNLLFFIKDYLTAVGGALFLIAALASTRLGSLLQSRFFIFMGDISYSFYLLHLPILITVCSVFSSRFAYSSLYIFVSAVLLSFITSAAVFRFIEKPFQQNAKKLVVKWKISDTLNLR
jgi:peptidoglycan/LPS O-acetylase OafA/YrhL